MWISKRKWTEMESRVDKCEEAVRLLVKNDEETLGQMKKTLNEIKIASLVLQEKNEDAMKSEVKNEINLDPLRKH